MAGEARHDSQQAKSLCLGQILCLYAVTSLLLPLLPLTAHGALEDASRWDSVAQARSGPRGRLLAGLLSYSSPPVQSEALGRSRAVHKGNSTSPTEAPSRSKVLPPSTPPPSLNVPPPRPGSRNATTRPPRQTPAPGNTSGPQAGSRNKRSPPPQAQSPATPPSKRQKEPPPRAHATSGSSPPPHPQEPGSAPSPSPGVSSTLTPSPPVQGFVSTNSSSSNSNSNSTSSNSTSSNSTSSNSTSSDSNSSNSTSRAEDSAGAPEAASLPAGAIAAMVVGLSVALGMGVLCAICISRRRCCCWGGGWGRSNQLRLGQVLPAATPSSKSEWSLKGSPLGLWKSFVGSNTIEAQTHVSVRRARSHSFNAKAKDPMLVSVMHSMVRSTKSFHLGLDGTLTEELPQHQDSPDFLKPGLVASPEAHKGSPQATSYEAPDQVPAAADGSLDDGQDRELGQVHSPSSSLAAQCGREFQAPGYDCTPGSEGMARDLFFNRQIFRIPSGKELVSISDSGTFEFENEPGALIESLILGPQIVELERSQQGQQSQHGFTGGLA